MALVGGAAAAAGLGLQAYGTVQQMSASKKSAAANQAIAAQEAQQEALRRKAMELDARRRQMEMLRVQQRNRAMSLTAATAQGAGQGSGLQGGYGQSSGQTGVNLLGVTQNLEIGRGLFDASAAISQQRYNLAGYSSQAAQGAGWASLGGALVTASPQFKGFARGNPQVVGGQPSGSYLDSYGGQIGRGGFGRGVY